MINGKKAANWGLQHRLHPLRAEQSGEWLQASSVTRMFAWWHMAGWWRHVLLSRIHQRPLPCDFIIPFKFLSCPGATFFSEGNVWLSLVVTVAQKMRFSRGSGATNVPLSLEAIRCWYYFALEPILGLHSLFWNFQVMHEVGTSLPAFLQSQCFFYTRIRYWIL